MSTTQNTASPVRARSWNQWLVLLLCWISFTMTSVDRSTWGPASIVVGEHLAVPLASLGAFATAYYVGYVISNAGGGIFADRLGGRLMLSVSLFLAGAFMMVFGSTTSAAMGIAVQAIVGLFAGADYSAGVKLISSWFPPEKLGLAMGIFTSATSLGTAIANAVVPSLIASAGWQASYHLFGALSMVTAVVCYVFVRPGPTTGAAIREQGSFLTDMRSLARNRNLVLVGLAGFGGFWGTYGFVTWSNTLMVKGHHISPTKAGIVVVVFATAAVIAKPLIGLVADFFGGARKVPAIIMFALFAATLVLFGSVGEVSMLLWIAPVLGVAAYGYTPLLVALTPRLVPATLTGSAAGIINAVWQIGSVLVPLAVGTVFQATHSFTAAFLTLAAGPLAGILLMLGVREPARRRRSPRLDDLVAADVVKQA
jgi:sugar phosphate permease